MNKLIIAATLVASLSTGAFAETYDKNSTGKIKATGDNVITITDISCENGEEGFVIKIANEKVSKIGTYDSCSSAKITFEDQEDWTLPAGHSVPEVLIDGTTILVINSNTGAEKFYDISDLGLSESDLVDENAENTGTISNHTFSVSEGNELYLNGELIESNFVD